MPLPDRKQKPVRLTAEQLQRLARAVRVKGQTEQSFMQAAIMAKIEETEAEVEAAKEKRARKRADAEPTSKNAPTGLGLISNPLMHALVTFSNDVDDSRDNNNNRLAATSTPTPALTPTPAPTPTPPNSLHDSSSKSLPYALANFVLRGGPDYARESRERLADDVLRSNFAGEVELAAAVTEFKTALSTREKPTGIRSAIEVFKQILK